MADDLRTQSNGSTTHMPRIFSLTSTLAMAFSITNTWIGYSATFVTPLLAGGGPAVVFCLILACVACTIIALGLAELASAFPSSGGQYHFASMVSTERYRAPVAFTVGWISILGWLFTTASTTIFCSQTSLMLASLYHPSYIWTAWQVWLIYTLITAISCLFIILLPQWIPAAEKVFLFSSLLGLIVAFVTVLATSQEKQPAKVIFAEWVNVTGWPDGLAFILATGQAMYGFLGMDGATHIAEELPNPERTVPKVIIMIMAIAINSQAAATFFTVWICFIYYGALVSCFVTSGRLIWAFSRDGGLPYSHIFAKIHPTLLAPVNATLLAGAFMVVFGLLYIASTTAYNSIVGLAILATNLTCAIPQTIVLIRGRRVLPKRYLNLGAIRGTFCNVFSTLYVALYTVLFLAAESMNYLSVVLVGALVFVTILWWAGKRHTFHGPSLQSEGVVIESRVVENGAKSLRLSKQSDKAET
ncbi:amino acid permease-domain-containing protein [Ilyonectria sp. MPI-CAGE-AT-0026]|nr:amino acid permease-domain-containing protein [Ilyonectria sp. MPI-CAGE-AT-0026]